MNRIVRCTQDGWEVEPDQRLAYLIVQELDLRGANGVTTPGENEPRSKESESDEELEPTEATWLEKPKKLQPSEATWLKRT